MQDGQLANEEVFNGGELKQYLLQCQDKLLRRGVYCLTYSNTTGDDKFINLLSDADLKPEKGPGLGCKRICKKSPDHPHEPSKKTWTKLQIGLVAALAGIITIMSRVIYIQVCVEFFH